MAESVVGMTASANPAVEAKSQRELRLTLWIFLFMGAIFTSLNIGLPIARNALCYAKGTLGLLQNHFNFFAVAHDRAWTAGKPIFFMILAGPLAWMFGLNTGIVIAGFIGTVFFLGMAVLALPRLNKRCGVDPKLMPLEFVLIALNPLAVYQFWAAYPDSLFAGLTFLAFILIDIIATEPERDTRWHIVGLGATILVAIHTKLYGASLMLMCLLSMPGRSRSDLLTWEQRLEFLPQSTSLLRVC
jgi:hypothetical protein